ncbi:hypothetical protein BXZ70DRAFT_1007920 [Cristinia sonorae]|uniref:DUF6533 domain-containing protein n=1 Tax=Cristinia sonorae TaxID=1940300 RepID=A0A8K0UQI5_9AGAR|nr:hypothetical protein BXZ70DRAFT_1007920 [Cristinia sonorae]
MGYPADMVLYNETLALQYTYTFAAFTLASYDICLSFSREVERIWKGKFSAVTVLYLALRSGVLVHTILDLLIVAYVPSTVLLRSFFQSCKFIYAFGSILDIVSHLCVAAFSTLRIWAISSRSRHRNLMTLAVFVLCLFIPCVNIYGYTNYHYSAVEVSPADDPEGAGAGSLSAASRSPQHLGTITRAVAITGDMLVLVLTWINTYDWTLSEEVRRIQKYSILMLVNGSLYFIALLALNIVALILDVYEDGSFSTQFTIMNAVYDFTLCPRSLLSLSSDFSSFTNILVCHFILDLRDLTEKGMNESVSSQEISRIHFRAVGNIGASLDVQGCLDGTAAGNDLQCEYSSDAENRFASEEHGAATSTSLKCTA